MRGDSPVRRASHIPIASVRTDQADWHVGHVPLVDLSDLHWDRPARPGRGADPVLYAFTSCDALVAGELPHGDGAARHPHALRVCILRDDNDHELFDRLVLEAGRPPRTFRTAA